MLTLYKHGSHQWATKASIITDYTITMITTRFTFTGLSLEHVAQLATLSLASRGGPEDIKLGGVDLMIVAYVRLYFISWQP